MQVTKSLFSLNLIALILSADLILGLSLAEAFSGTGLPPPAIIHCRQKKGTQTDNSNVALGFAGGVATNIAWDGTKMALSAGQSSGNFVSRVFDTEACHGVTPWLNFQWATTLPFFKELPNTSESSTNYSAKTANLMTSIRGIWHFNETGYNGTVDEVVDSSGNGHHGRYWTGSVTNVAGLFNNATQPNSDHINVTNLPNMTEVFTYQIWIKTTDPTDWVAISQRRDASLYGWQIQLDTAGIPYIRIDTSAGSNQTNCYAATSVIDGNWHHIVISINNGNCAIYLNGVKDTGTYTRGTGWTSAATLYLDRHMTGTYDEAALWDRVLSDTEVLELYRRGINRVKFQVRSCTSSTCADNPAWKGPDGTNTTYFTELNNNSNQVTGLGTVQAGAPNMTLSNFTGLGLINRYFQYKMFFETDNTTYSPDVSSVGITK